MNEGNFIATVAYRLVREKIGSTARILTKVSYDRYDRCTFPESTPTEIASFHFRRSNCTFVCACSQEQSDYNIFEDACRARLATTLFVRQRYNRFLDSQISILFRRVNENQVEYKTHQFAEIYRGKLILTNSPLSKYAGVCKVGR